MLRAGEATCLRQRGAGCLSPVPAWALRQTGGDRPVAAAPAPRSPWPWEPRADTPTAGDTRASVQGCAAAVSAAAPRAGARSTAQPSAVTHLPRLRQLEGRGPGRCTGCPGAPRCGRTQQPAAWAALPSGRLRPRAAGVRLRPRAGSAPGRRGSALPRAALRSRLCGRPRAVSARREHSHGNAAGNREGGQARDSTAQRFPSATQPVDSGCCVPASTPQHLQCSLGENIMHVVSYSSSHPDLT